MTKRDNIIKWSIVGIFVALYLITSIVSTIHVIDFFRLSNPEWLAITLAIAFEIGAAASLAAIVILDKTSKALIWMLFILITGMQVTGNMYYAYVHLENFQGWIELFGLEQEELIYQKRILSIVSGAILPIVALGFIKSLVDYIRPTKEIEDENKKSDREDELIEREKLHTSINEDIEDEVIDSSIIPHTDFRGDSVTDNTLLNEQKSHTEIEVKLAKAIANNPELKDKLKEEIKKQETEDKYRKPDSSISDINRNARRYGAL